MGDDLRYANDGSKIKELGWSAQNSFDEWLKKTVKWYQENKWWWEPLLKDRPSVDGAAQQKYAR